jgi:hypothetical protein
LTGVTDLMLLATLDQHKRALSQFDPLAFDDGRTLAGDDVEPLVSAAMPIVWPTLGLARNKHHLRGL